jgi:outer membrane protein assembly factor BamB
MPSRPATTALACLTLGLLLAGLALVARQPGRNRLDPTHSLHLQWVRDFPPPRPAWPDQPRLTFDAAARPVLYGDLVLLGSSHTDSLSALDAATGQERWRFHAEGPVRFAPAVWEDRVYLAADDGWMYCLDVQRGRLLWKFRGGPSDRRVLGNERLISTWPARGAPVVVAENGQPGDPRRPAHHAAEATVYFAAGIWPFMGVFLHALDARSGEVLWTNGGDGSMYVKQPHQADAFAGVAPQGPLVVVGDKLLVPGRSAPACYDRATGRLIHYRLADNSKLSGGAQVLANNYLFVNGGGAFDLNSGDYLGSVGEPAVLAGDVLYAVNGPELRGLDARRSGRKPRPADRKGPPPGLTRLASVAVPAVGALAVGGDWLYVGSGREVFATPLPIQNGRLPRVWQSALDGTPDWLVADDERLVVSTHEGRLPDAR